MRHLDGLLPSASDQRPPLASPLSRFDASYTAPGGGAVAEARCEVGRQAAPLPDNAVAHAMPAATHHRPASAPRFMHPCWPRQCTSAPLPLQVSQEGVSSGGQVCAAGDYLAFAGGTGWKQREPCLQAGRIPTYGTDLSEVHTGFFEP